MAPSTSPDPSPHSTAARKTSFFVPFSSMPVPRASTSHGSPLPRASHSSSRGSLGHAAPHQSPRERMLITSFGDPKSIAATRNSVRSSAFSKGGRKSVLASMLSSDTQSTRQEHGKSKRNALNSGNSALVQDAARRRNEMQKRLEFFELLIETASQVEGAMTLIQLQQLQQQQKTREEAELQGIDEMDSPTELALNKVRVSKLMGTLHLDKVVTKLKDVLDWLESASDPSGVHERRYVQAESESEEAAIAARIAANQVFADMHERETLTEEKLQSFANELSDVIRRKVQRDLAKLKRANKLRLTSSMDPKGMELGLDSDVVQLEITVGLLRTQLLRREEQQRLAGSNLKNLRSSLVALKAHTPDIADKLKQMTTITRDQAAHIMEQEWRNQQWREEVSLLKESILELNFEMSRSTQRLAVLNEDVFSYRVERSTYEDELTERSLQHTESLKKAIKPSAELEALFGAHDTLAFQAAELRFEVEQAAANASTKKKGLHDRLFPLLKERQEIVAVLSAFSATRAGLENIPETITKSRGCSAVRPSSAGSEGRSSVRSSSSILTSMLIAADPGSEAAETALSQLREVFCEMKAPLASRAAEAHQAQNAFEADSIMREKREHLVASIHHVEEVLKAEGAKLERLKLQREDEPQMDHADVTSVRAGSFERAVSFCDANESGKVYASKQVGASVEGKGDTATHPADQPRMQAAPNLKRSEGTGESVEGSFSTIERDSRRLEDGECSTDEEEQALANSSNALGTKTSLEGTTLGDAPVSRDFLDKNAKLGVIVKGKGPKEGDLAHAKLETPAEHADGKTNRSCDREGAESAPGAVSELSGAEDYESEGEIELPELPPGVEAPVRTWAISGVLTQPEVELMKYLHSDGKEILQMVRSQLDKSAQCLGRKISRKTVSSGEAQLSWAASATQSWLEQLDQAIEALASEIEKSWKLTEGGLGFDIRELGDEVARVLEIYKHVQNRSKGATNYDVTNNRTPNHGSRTNERTSRPLPSLATEIDANDGLEHGYESAQSPTSTEHRRSCLNSSRRHQEGPGKTGQGKKLSWLGDQDHDNSQNDATSPCCARTYESSSARLAGEMHSDGVESEAGTQYMRPGENDSHRSHPQDREGYQSDIQKGVSECFSTESHKPDKVKESSRVHSSGGCIDGTVESRKCGCGTISTNGAAPSSRRCSSIQSPHMGSRDIHSIGHNDDSSEVREYEQDENNLGRKSSVSQCAGSSSPSSGTQDGCLAVDVSTSFRKDGSVGGAHDRYPTTDGARALTGEANASIMSKSHVPLAAKWRSENLRRPRVAQLEEVEHFQASHGVSDMEQQLTDDLMQEYMEMQQAIEGLQQQLGPNGLADTKVKREQQVAQLHSEVNALHDEREALHREEDERIFNDLLEACMPLEALPDDATPEERAKHVQLSNLISELRDDQTAARKRERELTRWHKRWSLAYGATADMVVTDTGEQISISNLTADELIEHLSPIVLSQTRVRRESRFDSGAPQLPRAASVFATDDSEQASRGSSSVESDDRNMFPSDFSGKSQSSRRLRDRSRNGSIKRAASELRPLFLHEASRSTSGSYGTMLSSHFNDACGMDDPDRFVVARHQSDASSKLRAASQRSLDSFGLRSSRKNMMHSNNSDGNQSHRPSLDVRSSRMNVLLHDNGGWETDSRGVDVRSSRKNVWLQNHVDGNQSDGPGVDGDGKARARSKEALDPSERRAVDASDELPPITPKGRRLSKRGLTQRQLEHMEKELVILADTLMPPKWLEQQHGELHRRVLRGRAQLTARGPHISTEHQNQLPGSLPPRVFIHESSRAPARQGLLRSRVFDASQVGSITNEWEIIQATTMRDDDGCHFEDEEFQQRVEACMQVKDLMMKALAVGPRDGVPGEAVSHFPKLRVGVVSPRQLQSHRPNGPAQHMPDAGFAPSQGRAGNVTAPVHLHSSGSLTARPTTQKYHQVRASHVPLRIDLSGSHA